MTETITFSKAHLHFAGALKKLREQKGLSQGDIFRKTGIERSYLSRLESGQIDDPRLTTVVVLARALGLSVDDLVREAVAGAEAEEKRLGRLSKKK